MLNQKGSQEAYQSAKKTCCLPCCSCSGWKMVVCVVVGLMIVAGAVYAGYQLGRRSISPRELLVPPKPIATQIPIDNGPVEIEVSPPPEVKSEEIKDWKTYTSSVYGFSVKYPEKYIPKDLGHETTSFVEMLNGKEVTKVTIYKDFAGGWGCLNVLSTEEIFVSGIKEKLEIHADALAENNCSEEDPNGEHRGVVSLKRNDVTWLFLLNINKSEEAKEIATFKKILSTFKFLD